MIKALVLTLTIVTVVFALFQNCSSDYIALFKSDSQKTYDISNK